jgi:mono/diheme cytochrome c family protein
VVDFIELDSISAPRETVIFLLRPQTKKGKVMMKKLILLSIIGLYIAGCDSGATVAPEPPDPVLKPAKAIFEAKCSLCHSISRPLGKNKTPMGWNETVTRMQQKAPDKISDTDVKAIVDYLNAVRSPKK